MTNQNHNKPISTDWEKEFDATFDGIDYWNDYADPDEIKSFIRNLLTSRDTYWKEKVNELKLTEREIEIIVQDTVGQAYQTKFNANLDYDQWVGIRDEMMRCAKRISEKIENNVELNRQALDTLLDNLK